MTAMEDASLGQCAEWIAIYALLSKQSESDNISTVAKTFILEYSQSFSYSSLQLRQVLQSSSIIVDDHWFRGERLICSPQPAERG